MLVGEIVSSMNQSRYGSLTLLICFTIVYFPPSDEFSLIPPFADYTVPRTILYLFPAKGPEDVVRGRDAEVLIHLLFSAVGEE